MSVDTRKEAVEAFIQSTLKEHVLSEGMPRTSVDTQDAYAVVELLRSFLEKVEALEARVAAADGCAKALEAAYSFIFDEYYQPNRPDGKCLRHNARGTVDAILDALAAYGATKKGGA